MKEQMKDYLLSVQTPAEQVIGGKEKARLVHLRFVSTAVHSRQTFSPGGLLVSELGPHRSQTALKQQAVL